MSSRTAVAVAQWGPGADREVNLAELRELAKRAVKHGAGLVVFPEYSGYFTPKPDEGWIANAEALNGPFVSGLSAIAAELGVIIVAGFLEVSSQPDRCRNTIVAVGADGSLLATSPKLHLYDAFGAQESRWVEPGEIGVPQLFDFAGLRVGIQTCYDLRFPEVTRRLADAGADLVLVPAEWVAGPGKRHAWVTLATARAIENTVYLAAADHPPPIGVGASLIVDPMGERLAYLDDEVDVALASPDRDHLDEVRRINPALQLRRFGVSPL
ncbi:MAG: carbon-nitrogen hydrolase family protein [Microcella sp.]|uniref:carbon-nitrogen hydrolase family protein n=1 Tax=Microcella sp. TaxID=1913979 RepID=UPI003314EE8C